MTTIITGASSGIGQAIAKHILSTSSGSVFLTARTEEPLKELATQYGLDRVGYLVADIAKEETSKAIVDQALSQFNSIQTVIANAGMLEPVERVDDVHIGQWKKHFDVNYFSVVDLVSRALPHLKKTNGNVILVSSGASTKATVGWAAYGASKAAINHFALSVAHEVPEVRAVAIAPGVVDTKMQGLIRGDTGKNMVPQELKRFLDLKNNNELLDPSYVGAIYGNLALRGVPDSLNGQYVRYNHQLLQDFTK